MVKKEKAIDCLRFLQKLNGKINKDFTSIRFLKGESWHYNGRIDRSYGYFELKDRIIVECERGFSNWKGYKLLNCETCYQTYPELRMKNIFTNEEC